MKIADVIESGIAGAATLSLLQDALQQASNGSHAPLLYKSDTFKKLRKQKKSGRHDKELYVKLAGELMTHAAYFGLTGLGKKKNAVLRGGLLGAAAGLGVAFLQNEPEKGAQSTGIDADGKTIDTATDAATDKIITVILYTAGGVLAGMAIKALDSKKVKKSKWAKPLKKIKKSKKAAL